MTSNGQNATLREATQEDVDDVADIWHLGWQDGHLGSVSRELIDARTEASFRSRAAERIGVTTVAIVDGVVAGFVMVVDDEVEQVYVSHDHRGSGVATALLAEAERQIRVAGHDSAWLAVVPGNGRARRFYERSGWSDAGPFDYPASDRGRPIPVHCHRYVKAVR